MVHAQDFRAQREPRHEAESHMALSSTGWIVVIAVGAVVLAVGNIQYNRARDFENKSSKANQARELLTAELTHNKEMLKQMRDSLPASSLTLEDFDTTAWRTVSNTDLLLGLPNEELTRLMQTYRLIIRSNELRSKTLELMLGVTSALQNASQTREMYMKELSSTLAQLEPLLNALVP